MTLCFNDLLFWSFQETLTSVFSEENKPEEGSGGINRLVTPEDFVTPNQPDTVAANQSTVFGSQSGASATGSSDKEEKKKVKPKQIRLCNGEIFFVLEVLYCLCKPVCQEVLALCLCI